MTVMRKVGVSAVVLSMLSVSACQTDGTGTREQAAMLGAGLGAVAGIFIGGDGGRLVGGLIGTAVGGAIGYAIGSALEERKAQYASEEAFYDAQITESRKLNAELGTRNDQLAQEVRELNSQTDALLVAYQRNEADRAALASRKSDLDKQSGELSRQVALLREEAEVQSQVVAEVRASGDTARAEALEQEVAVLENEIAELQGMVSDMGQQSAALGQYL